MIENSSAYLTIDDGPSPATAELMDFLIDRAVPAIMFFQGSAIESYFEHAVQAVKRGFVVGNHSFSHPLFHSIDIARAKTEISSTDVLIDKVYAAAGMPRRYRFFRFPYGDKGDNTMPTGKGDSAMTDHRRALQHILADLGYAQPQIGVDGGLYGSAGFAADNDWYWTYDCAEWVLSEPSAYPHFQIQTLSDVLARMDNPTPPQGWQRGTEGSPDIVLLHDHGYPLNAFKACIDRLVQRGVRFKSIK